MSSELSTREAEDAIDNGDKVTSSEIQEMYPDKTMNKIEYDMAIEEAKLELQSKIEESYKFNEPRAAAKQGRKTCHTGPKGVLTDYEEAKLKLRANRIENKIKKGNKYYMNIDNNKNETKSKLTIIENKDKDDDDINDDEEDEEILLKYKLEKMRILEENRPQYGNTKELTAWTFEKEVDDAPNNIFIVIHVYQDYLERCARMNYVIAQIAKSYPNIKFLRARSDRLGLDNYPDIGLPTFIIFKNGIQLQNHIAIHTLIPNPFNVKDVESFLIKNKIIKPIVIIPNIKQMKKISIQNNINDDSDSELDID